MDVTDQSENRHDAECGSAIAVVVIAPIGNLIKPEARRRIYWANVSIHTKVWVGRLGADWCYPYRRQISQVHGVVAGLEAQEQVGALYRDPQGWAQKAILNVASSGKFSSNRTIHEYTSEIWKVDPCPIP